MSSCHFTTCAGLGRDICPPPMQRTILSKLDVARNDRRDAHVGMRRPLCYRGLVPGRSLPLRPPVGCLAHMRPRSALRALANHPTGRFAHWPIIPRGSLCDNQVWIVLIMHSLICSSVCAIPPRVSCVGINLGDLPRGYAPWEVPSVDPSTLHTR